ncbi:hypothetical protein DFR49_2854 [Hephaestia caeni]|uniref:Core-binding (CB) domain-containing protein n=1 Tax=Hephaestia caeni TaxID=645617 RepID=A0A397PBW4_9SPHN|nr:hypothetical protein [Hephaestia caeni]RIA44607.1 hypothetical protein DFR49_2854 [Hephaestia caeni]
MNGKRNREAILEFQDYQAAKGLLAKGTAMARKAALGKVLGILPDEEAEDVTKIHLDDVMLRFSNLQGKDYTPGSMNTYKSRVKAALEDFEAYLSNPLGFRPNINRRDRSSKSDKPQVQKVDSTTPTEIVPKSTTTSFESVSILPIPLRSDLVVRIQGLPFDMTENEARKIANVVLAMVNPTS